MAMLSSAVPSSDPEVPFCILGDLVRRSAVGQVLHYLAEVEEYWQFQAPLLWVPGFCWLLLLP